LEHQWLSDPKSQPTQSQPQGLGGDSMWAIESFDHDQPPIVESLPADSNRPRQATISGTNFDSVLLSNSQEDFSQPMNQLHLGTPASKALHNAKHPIDIASWCEPSKNMRHDESSAALLSSPSDMRRPSPVSSTLSAARLSPVKETHVENFRSQTNRTTEPSDGAGDIDLSINHKRKRDRPSRSGTNNGKMEESGSLSPAPTVEFDSLGQSVELPKRSPDDIRHATRASSRIKARMSHSHSATTKASHPAAVGVTRHSPKLSRKRKSMRLD
jgi:hypothetical protein